LKISNKLIQIISFTIVLFHAKSKVLVSLIQVPVPVMPLNSIPGYDMVPLLEALNGPYQSSSLQAGDGNLNASSARQEAVRVLNMSNESEEPNPIAMTVMVSPSQPTLEDIPEKGSDASISPVNCRHVPNNSTAELKSLSDPDYENHFSEDVLPNLQSFPSPSGHNDFPPKVPKETYSRCDINDKSSEDLRIQSLNINHDHLHMIAAIDEFSDEEDPCQIKVNLLKL